MHAGCVSSPDKTHGGCPERRRRERAKRSRSGAIDVKERSRSCRRKRKKERVAGVGLAHDEEPSSTFVCGSRNRRKTTRTPQKMGNRWDRLSSREVFPASERDAE